MEMFNADHCTKEQLVHRCRELMFSEENTELAIEFFITKTRQIVIADQLNIDVKSVIMRKYRMKKLLNKGL